MGRRRPDAAATLIPMEQIPDDPNVRQAISEASMGAGSKWPGATLPDIGQLTAQASRIATDIAAVANRVQTAFDSQAVQGRPAPGVAEGRAIAPPPPAQDQIGIAIDCDVRDAMDRQHVGHQSPYAARTDEQPPRPFPNWLRQRDEAIIWTLKHQLGLEHHGGRVPAGLWARVVQRLLALNTAIWHNWTTGAPVKRSLIAYDH